MGQFGFSDCVPGDPWDTGLLLEPEGPQAGESVGLATWRQQSHCVVIAFVGEFGLSKGKGCPVL